MTKEITALTLVSTALDVLEKYKCQELFETMSVRGIQPVKHEIDDILTKLIAEEYKNDSRGSFELLNGIQEVVC